MLRSWTFASLSSLLFLAGTKPARALPPSWLSIGEALDCVPSARDLEHRIEGQVVGMPNPELAVQLNFSAGPEQTLAKVVVSFGLHVVGEKNVSTPSCTETVDAVVAVVALALSSSPTRTPTAPLEDLARDEQALREGEFATEVEPTVAEPERREFAWRATGLPYADDGGERMDAPESPWSAWGSVGVDHGTFGEALGMAGLGGARVWGRSELRAAGWYGLASRREEVTGEGYSRESADFGAMSFDFCHGIDRGRWLSACGGAELGWLRLSRVERDVAGRGFDEEHFGPSFAPKVSTLMALRAGPVQPELSFAALFPVVGRAPRGDRFALRASLGAAVPF